ncbi:hypothetical protein CP973_05770 [Streptomyces albofaciens JCM 4342]|uniref:DUF7544 domain-containing protein n=1 Tax=Streptomyces albofaciens TaxID=66866 RepID=UPI00123A6ECB|nr:hypothetical protein [Streptomyces albofaciens]KAA6221547.1 hypothetical protein CP973_05770 [Streptomyces albofaciens JCM 4342]
MNNSPGWASPGSSPSDEPDRTAQGRPATDETGAADRAGADAPADPAGSTGTAGPAEPAGPAGAGASGDSSVPPQWSKEQPPPGQWSAPTGGPGRGGPGGPGGQGGWGGQQPGGGGQPGWGGRPGWGAPWAPPPAAKPGVIPLRPLGVGEILDGAVSTMRAHWRTVLGISLVVAVVAQAANTIVTGLWFRNAGDFSALDNNPDASLSEAMDAVDNTLIGSALTSLIGLLGTIIVTALLTIVVSRAVLGRSVSTGEAWRDARSRLPRLLGLLLLLPLIFSAVILLGMVPGIIVTAVGPAAAGVLLTLLGGLGAAVVGVWLWVRFSLAAPALMLEKQGVIASMRRSAKLVRGAWWRVLGVQLLTYLLIIVVGMIVQIPATIVAVLVSGEGMTAWTEGAGGAGWTFLTVLGIGSVITSAVTYPISAGVTALLYMDQRIRREALDLELARAAGLPGYGADVPGPGAPGPHGTGPDSTGQGPAGPTPGS